MSDPVADLLTRIRNASAACHRYVEVSHSKHKEEIVKVLKKTGFIAHYLVKEENKKGTMRIFLKYSQEREPVLQGIKRCSRPARRLYVSAKQIPRPFQDLGVAILSTPQGVTDGVSARDAGQGGELLAIAW